MNDAQAPSQPKARTSDLTKLGFTGLVGFVLAALLLNGLLSMNPVWPTPWVEPDARLAPEFVWTWVLLLGLAACKVRLTPSLLRALTAVFLLLVAGRYVDIMVPSMFGRPINVFWDIPQIPRVVWVWTQEVRWWQALGAVLIATTAVAVLFGVVKRCIQWLALRAAPWALRRWWMGGLTLLAAALCVANHAGVRETWPYVSKPVTPVFWQQAKLVGTVIMEQRSGSLLPPSPTLDAAVLRAKTYAPADVLPALKGQNVVVIMLESYGAVLWDNPRALANIAASRNRFANDVKASGQHMVSAFMRSPTFAGGSDLAHLSVLSGIDLSDPLRHDVLLTTQRPTLTSLFKQLGYETFGLYSGLSWDWPESRFYGFEVFLDGRDLQYRGPKLGYWYIPDQFAMAKFDVLHPRMKSQRPQFVFFPTITTHMPFSPVPPFQPDWQKVLTQEPFDTSAASLALAKKPNWLNMFDDYVSMFDYMHTWLGSYLKQPEAQGGDRGTVYVLVGDHQPASNISGNDASWDVPVHIVSRDTALLQRFKQLGFADGLNPPRRSLGGLHELTGWLLQGFGAMAPP
jgi:hypothetical protein